MEMFAKPQAEHRWLEKMVGEWTFESEGSCGEGAAPQKSRGLERVRALGGLWVVGESDTEMPDGTPAKMMITLGFDVAKQRFVGTFVGSMMSHLWVYEGELDAAGKVLTLRTEGPSMAGDGTMVPYEDIIELVSDDHRVLTGRFRAPDGTWSTMMTAHYRRKR